MRAFLNLYRANLTEFLSNRRALFLTVAFPILFITIFGLVFTNQDKADAKIGLAAADPDDPVARALVDALRDLPKARIDKDGKPDAKNAEHNPFSEDAVITLPAGLADQAAQAKERALKAAVEEKQDMEDMNALLDDDDAAKPAASPLPTPAPTPTTGDVASAGKDLSGPQAKVYSMTGYPETDYGFGPASGQAVPLDDFDFGSYR